MEETTLLHRQIHPSWIQNRRVTSQSFKPTPKDELKLSVYDGDQISPERSWRHYTSSRGLTSVGVRSVSVSECSRAGLVATPDPAEFPEHVVIDFTELTSIGQIEKASKKLNAAAEQRGWQYQPNDD